MVDLRGRLDPESIPGTKLDTDTIAEQAATLGSTGTAIGGAGADAALEWQSMATHYVAPEGDLLLGLMGPVETMTSAVSADTATAQGALATFADEAAPIVKKLVDLKVEAWNFLTKTEFGITIPGDSPYNIHEKARPRGKLAPPPSANDKPESVHLDWDQYQPWVDENEERQADVTTQATLLAEKAATCVNVLLPMVETVLGEEIPEYVPINYAEFEASGGELPWGVDVPDAHTDGIHFAAGILESLTETISGLGTLVLGFNPETGGFFDGSVWGPSWVSTLALAGALVVQPLDDLLDGLQQGNVDDDWLDGADNGLSAVVGDEAWKTTWEGFVGTPEDWEKNPAQAAGSLTFNIGTVLIPTGAGAAAKATALGEKVSSVAAKAAAAAADAGVPVSLSVKLGQLLADGLLTVGGGLTKLDDALNAALKPFADALAKADTSVADFAAWVKSLPEFQGPDGQFAGIPNGGRIPEVPSGGKPDPWPSTATPDVRTPEMPGQDRTPGSPGGLLDEHGGVRDPGGRGPDLDGDGTPDVRDPDGTERQPQPDSGLDDVGAGDEWKPQADGKPVEVPTGAPEKPVFTIDPDSGISPEYQARIARYDQLLNMRDADGNYVYDEHVRAAFRGNIFNLENYDRYRVPELHVTKPGASSYNRIDSFDPEGVIVERKNTQLAEVQPATWKSYLNEITTKYAIDSRDVLVADTPTNRADLEAAGYDSDDFIGKPLHGQQVLEVPVQNGPPPAELLKFADDKDIQVKDVTGTEWIVSEDGGTVTAMHEDGTRKDYPVEGMST
ncbi:hypothetical protein C5E10_12525 [Pseudoclavibacter sp. RFBG4]|uniref:hypothetical protein n=1 Tax=Pseudoclavibacter sp. RFBG4 TaxID=2080575 RepID=UPI000CE7D80D|nr:hypothetical protein [Pseudoclavibacter sp. RFBG4]PPG30270.1 hypothetical protein C5E10_12525 [Pseudoclavibacter sp. RFBG4]